MIHVAAVVYSDDRESARRERRTFCHFKRRKFLPTLLARLIAVPSGGEISDSYAYVFSVELLASSALYIMIMRRASPVTGW
jgi:hypothetical protein